MFVKHFLWLDSIKSWFRFVTAPLAWSKGVQRICYRKKMLHWGFLGPTDACVSLEYLNERIASWRLLIFVFRNEHGWCQQRKKTRMVRSLSLLDPFSAHTYLSNYRKRFCEWLFCHSSWLKLRKATAPFEEKKCNWSCEEIHDTKGLPKHEMFVVMNSD